MKCPRCTVEMTVGFAIDPKFSGPGICALWPMKAKDIRFIFCYKCPLCGHSDDGES